MRHRRSLGGRDLEGAAPAYISFQIDEAGRFRVAEHTGDGLRELVPWTAHDGIAVLAEDAQSPAENVLAVDMRGEKAVFYVNEEMVAELPADQLRLDGVVGLRAGEGLSLHVTEIAIGPNRRDE